MARAPHQRLIEARTVAEALAQRGGVLMWFAWAWSQGQNTTDMAHEWRIPEAAAVLLLDEARRSERAAA